jgi:hypothetical protein
VIRRTVLVRQGPYLSPRYFNPENFNMGFILFAASLPAIVCVGASAFLAYKDRSQWMWFAALSVLAEYGGVSMLSTVQAWRVAAHL